LTHLIPAKETSKATFVSKICRLKYKFNPFLFGNNGILFSVLESLQF